MHQIDAASNCVYSVRNHMRTASNCVRGLREARFGQWHTSASGGQWFLDQVSMIQKKVLAAQQLIGRFRSGPRINAGVMGWFLGLYMASLPNLVLSAIILSMVLVSRLQENFNIIRPHHKRASKSCPVVDLGEEIIFPVR